MKVSGTGEVYEDDTLLGTVAFELEFGVGRSGQHECSGRVKSKGWNGDVSGRKGLVLALGDGRRFELEGQADGRISAWTLVHGVETPGRNL